MGHTQGEWVVESSDCMTAHYVLVNAYEYFEEGYKSDDPQTAIALREEDEANARLIAAAPDLLAACEDGLKFLDSITSGIGLESEKQNKAAFRRILKQAITKATQ